MMKAATVSAAGALLILVVAGAPPDAAATLAGPTPFLIDLHAHTAYSDGEGLPPQAFAAARGTGALAAFAVTDHSEWLNFPFRADPACLGWSVAACWASPLPFRTEWQAIGDAAAAATAPGFTGLRGFEWSSPYQGHVNVFDSDHAVDFIQTGGATMAGFYGWLATAAGADAIATFNHPGREPAVFEDFRYEPVLDERFVAVEAFNRENDHSDLAVTALDRGWHVGISGVTDGHGPSAWTNPDKGRTLVFAADGSWPALKDALHAHRTIATRGVTFDARFAVDGATLGATLTRDASDTVHVTVAAVDAAGAPFTRVELMGPQGWSRDVPVPADAFVTATAAVPLADVPVTDLGERFVLARLHQAHGPVIVTSPVWFAS